MIAKEGILLFIISPADLPPNPRRKQKWNGEWGMGNGEWGMGSKILAPTPHSPFPTTFPLLFFVLFKKASEQGRLALFEKSERTRSLFLALRVSLHRCS